MDSEVLVATRHPQGVARRQIRQRPFDQDVGAAVEAEILKVDTRAQR
jgi:hypothetical protein